jgi:GTP-binding protein HflX
VTGFGVEGLLQRHGQLLTQGARRHSITITESDGQRIAWLHSHGEVLSEEDAGEGEGGPMRRIEVRLTDKELGRFEALAG